LLQIDIAIAYELVITYVKKKNNIINNNNSELRGCWRSHGGLETLAAGGGEPSCGAYERPLALPSTVGDCSRLPVRRDGGGGGLASVTASKLGEVHVSVSSVAITETARYTGREKFQSLHAPHSLSAHVSFLFSARNEQKMLFVRGWKKVNFFIF